MEGSGPDLFKVLINLRKMNIKQYKGRLRHEVESKNLDEVYDNFLKDSLKLK